MIPYIFSHENWNLPLRWNEAAPYSTFAGRKGFWPVLCSSLADVFDNEVPDQWRMDLFTLIANTPNLTWLLLTKRIGNVATMATRDGLMFDLLATRVWLGATVVNQEEADRDIPKLLATPAAKRFVSYEPALGPVDWTNYVRPRFRASGYSDWRDLHDPLDWIIVGGESDQPTMKARPFDVEWAESTVAQCKAAGVSCFVKQMGSNPGLHVSTEAIEELLELPPCDCPPRFWPLDPPLKDCAGADPSEWLKDLQVQEWPR